MTELERVLRRLTADLQQRRVSWALVGGLAVSTRAEPRTTRDIDAAVAVSNDREAKQLVADLGITGYRVGAMLEHDVLDRLATVRLTGPSARTVVVLQFASSGIEQAVALAAEALELVAGLVVPVARTGHLIALKLLARDDRHPPHEHDDLDALSAAATESDWTLAADAVDAIQKRGAARGRDLVAALAALRSAP